jgi:hypothetical protein
MLAIEVVILGLDRLVNWAGIDSAVLEISGEQNVATWFSSVQFAAAAAVAAAAVHLGAARALVWGPVAAVGAVFSLDEVAMLHERVEGLTDGGALVNVVEPLVALFALAAAVYVLRHVSTRERLLLLAAGAALLLAQVFAAVNSDDLPAFQANALSAAEEWAEMLVGTFVLAAAAPLLVRGLQRRFGQRTAG